MLLVPEPSYPVMCPKIESPKLRAPSRALISCHVPQNCGAPICQIVAPAQFSWTSHVSAQCCCCNKQRTEQENLCDLKSLLQSTLHRAKLQFGLNTTHRVGTNIAQSRKGQIVRLNSKSRPGLHCFRSYAKFLCNVNLL